jgi:ubiquinone/menaquinone biosynthesis C-methylase UbiE
MTPAEQRNDDLARLRDEYARRQQAAGERYSLFNAGQLFLIQQRQRALLALLRREGFAPLASKRILELGCGSGGVLRELLWYGATPATLHGAELLDWRLAEARRATPHLPLVNADGQHLPYRDTCFDLVAQFTVFSSILDEQIKRRVAAEMRRVLRPGGLILWYDFWTNPLNPQTRGLRKAEIRALFPGCQFVFQRITLAAPLARWFGPYSWLACYLLERLRLFNTHYLVAIRPQSR